MAAITSNGTGGGVSSAGASWAGGVVPVEGDTVQILNGDTITLDTSHVWGADTATKALDVLNGATLAWDNLGSDTLTFKGHFIVRNGGTLTLDGTTNVGNVLTLRANYSAAPAYDKYHIEFEAGATINVDGYNKTRSYDTIAVRTSDFIFDTVNDNQAGGWQVGDVVTVTNDTGSSTSLDTIAGIVGTQITLTVGTADVGVGNYVQNLSRNIVVEAHTANRAWYGNFDGPAYNSITFDWVEFKDYACGTDAKLPGIVAKYGIFRYCSFRRTSANSFITAINFTGSDNFLVDNCVFYNTYSGNLGDIDIHSSTSGVVSYNVWALYNRGAWLARAFTKNIVVSNNVFLNAGAGNRPGISLTGKVAAIDISNCTFKGNTSTIGAFNLDACALITMSDSTFANCNIAVFLASPAVSTISDCVFGTSTTADVYLDSFGDVYFVDCAMNTAGKEFVLGVDATPGSHIRFKNCTNITIFHKSYKVYGSYEMQSTVKRTGTYGMLMSPNDANNALVAQSTVPAMSGLQIVVSGYFRKNAAYGGATLPYMTLSGCGVTVDTDTMTDVDDTWQLLVIKGTPTSSGFCKVEFGSRSAGVGAASYVDDVKMVYVAMDIGTMDFWFEGDMGPVLMATGLGALDIWNADPSQITAEASFGTLLKNLRNIMRFFQAMIA